MSPRDEMQLQETQELRNDNYREVKIENNRNMKVFLIVLLIAEIVSLSTLIPVIVIITDLKCYISTRYNTPTNTSFGTISAQLGDQIPKSEYLCLYNTSDEFLNTLTDDLSDEYCKPRTKQKDLFVGAMHLCPGGKLYIPLTCLCDSKQQCPGEEGLPRKHECARCRDERHCPCQNGGMCNECPYLSSTGDKVRCACKPGTSGRYCTKINQRVCHVNTTVTKLTPRCNISNERNCFIHDPTTNQSYLCQWSENILKLKDSKYPPCFTRRKEYKTNGTKNPLTVQLESKGLRNTTANEAENEYSGDEAELKNAETLLVVACVCNLIMLIITIILIWKNCRNCSFS